MKKRWFTRMISLLLVLVLLTLAAGCGKTEFSENSQQSSAPVTAPPTTTTTAPPFGLNVLTGQEDMKTDNNRPVAIVVTDEDSNLTQLNLEKADMFFEAETEAGIPRILAVFSSVDRLPNEVGPVRSARPHFVKIAKALDSIYCHIGGSETGKNTIKELGVNDIENASIVHDVLKNSKNVSWNRKAFTKEKILQQISSRKYRTTGSLKSPFQFGQKAGATTANTVVVRISNTYDMAFTYDAATGLYQKHRNALNTPVHNTYTGGPIAVRNVIVMFDRRTVDPLDAKRVDFDLNSGSGLLAVDGTSREIRWKRDSAGLHYYESDGVTALTVGEGKTFVCLASDTLKSRTTVS